jgi:hypothetical protein
MCTVYTQKSHVHMIYFHWNKLTWFFVCLFMLLDLAMHKQALEKSCYLSKWKHKQAWYMHENPMCVTTFKHFRIYKTIIGNWKEYKVEKFPIQRSLEMGKRNHLCTGPREGCSKWLKYLLDVVLALCEECTISYRSLLSRDVFMVRTKPGVRNAIKTLPFDATQEKYSIHY